MNKETRTSEFVPFDNLVVEENVRLPGHYQTDALSDDIEARGLNEALLVWLRKKGEYVILRGHRRYAAMQLIKERNPDCFNELFKKGVSTTTITGIDANRALELKVDHGNEVSLTDPYELQLCAKLLFDAGRTEADVAVQLSGLMDRIYPMKSKAKAELAALKKAVDDAKTERDKIIAENEAKQYTLRYRRGVVQGLHNAYRCPAIVMAALYYKATGEAPSGYEGKPLIKLTGTNVTTLFKAHKEDLKVTDDETGLSKYSKRSPGPAFWEAWNKIAEQHTKEAERRAEGNAKPKAKPASVMTEEAQTKWSSRGFRTLSMYYAGDNSMGEKLPALDETAYLAELVKDGDPDAWAEFVALAKGIEEAQIEATNEAAA